MNDTIPMAATGNPNNDTKSILARLREQANNYVPQNARIVIDPSQFDKPVFYKQETPAHRGSSKQDLNSLVAANILGSTTKSSEVGPKSKYNCYHMFCKSITNKYPTLSPSSSVLSKLWKRVQADGYRPQFQEAAKLFNEGRRDIFPNIDYEKYLSEEKLI
jgi:hypothetical protein